jgi:GTPase KRas protein
MIDGSTATIEVLGTAAQEVYPAMQQENLRVGYGSILVYSITSRSSFLAIVEFRAQAGMVKYGGRFRYYTEDKFPLILVGCHCEKESERVVSFDEGECLARQVGCPFLEVAYETGQNIEKAYYDLVREIRRYDANEI